MGPQTVVLSSPQRRLLGPWEAHEGQGCLRTPGGALTQRPGIQPVRNGTHSLVRGTCWFPRVWGLQGQGPEHTSVTSTPAIGGLPWLQVTIFLEAGV